MGLTAAWVVDFQIRKPNPAPPPGPSDLYRRPPRKALVIAANSSGIPAVLAADVPLANGEVLDVLNITQYVEGAESGAVWT